MCLLSPHLGKSVVFTPVSVWLPVLVTTMVWLNTWPAAVTGLGPLVRVFTIVNDGLCVTGVVAVVVVGPGTSVVVTDAVLTIEPPASILAWVTVPVNGVGPLQQRPVDVANN